MSILVDTNVVVRLFDSTDPQHALCDRVVREFLGRGEDLVVCAQVLIEFWAVATRPREKNGIGLDVFDANAHVEQIVRTFPCLLEPPDVADIWRQIVSRHSVSGKNAHDARLVAVMKHHQMSRILTLNRADFARYDGLEIIWPPDVASGLTR